MTQKIDIIIIDDPSKSTYPYMDMAIARAYLHKNGIDTNVHFFLPCSVEKYSNELAIVKPKMVIGLFSYRDAQSMMDALSIIKSMSLDTYITVSSSMTNIYHKEFLERFPFIDCVILGEPEETSLDLYDKVTNNKSLSDCLGISYRNSQGKIFCNPMRPYIADLDSLPFADRSHQKKFVLAHTHMYKNRGCSGTCTFCNDNCFRNKQSGNYLRFRSAEHVVDEIEHIITKSKNQNYKFSFYDYCFIDGGKKGIESASEVMNEILRRELKVVLHFQARAEQFNESLMPFLTVAKKAGLASILIGIESACDEDLKLYGKIAQTNDNLRAIETLRKADIEFQCGFINFNPYSTFEKIIKNVVFLEKTGLAKSFSFFTTSLDVHPETDIVKTLINDKLLPIDFDFMNVRHQIIWKDPIIYKLLIALQNVKLNIETHKYIQSIEIIFNASRNRLPYNQAQRLASLEKQFKIDIHEQAKINVEFMHECIKLAQCENIDELNLNCRKFDLSNFDKKIYEMHYMASIFFLRVMRHLA